MTRSKRQGPHWRPSTRVAQHVGNALLSAYRSGNAPKGWPEWGEAACIYACVHSNLAPGVRLKLGKMWLDFGREMSISPQASSEVKGQMSRALDRVA